MAKKIITINFLIIFIVCFLFKSTEAQEKLPESDNQMATPDRENFEESSDLIAPWRSSGCTLGNYEFTEPNCHLVTGVEYQSRAEVSIYNEDGSLWYLVNLNPQSPNYFNKNKKIEFSPFADNGVNDRFPSVVILRIIGESANWYKVEINEQTQAVKFILKQDTLWRRTGWDYWLHEGFNFTLNTEETPLLDNPQGQIIEASKKPGESRVKFIKTSGDWALVRTRDESGNSYDGWVRWRKGRNLIVGCFLNKFKLLGNSDIKN